MEKINLHTFYVSASQIETYKDCNRKWGFRSIDKIKTPQSPGAEYGSDLHRALEEFLKNGRLPKEEDFKKLIEKATQYLPEKTVPRLIEESFEISLPLNNTYLVGYIDCVVEEVPFGIIDHKYLSDLRYMKTEEELKNNIQAICYNYAAYREFHEKDFYGPIFNRWIYYNATGKKRPKKVGKVVPIEMEVSRAEAEERFQKIFDTYIKKMHKDFFNVGVASRLDPNYKSCKMYGGCSFIEKCKPNSTQRFMATMTQGDKKMANSKLIEKLKNNRKKTEKKSEKKTSRFAPTLKSGSDEIQKLGGVINKDKKTKKKPQTITHEELTELQEKKGAKGVNPEPAVSVSNPEVEIQTTKQNKLIVLFGSTVLKGKMDNTVHLIEFITPLLNMIAEEKQVEHWALLPLYEFKPLLAGAVDHHLTQNPISGTIIVQDRTTEADAVREVLLKHADLVIRGI